MSRSSYKRRHEYGDSQKTAILVLFLFDIELVMRVLGRASLAAVDEHSSTQLEPAAEISLGFDFR